jgi:hypothetical protein
MSVIVVDGPNKAGKSTLIENTRVALAALGFDVLVRHWGPLQTDDREYAEPLAEDCNADRVTIWDRSWASEHVYGKLLGRQNRRLARDPWLGEFLHRRAVIGNGQTFILAPRGDQNVKRLDASDADYSFSPAAETRAFIEYALRFKWHGLLNDYTSESLATNTNRLVTAATSGARKPLGKNILVGKNRHVLIIGSKHVDDPYPGGWLPFGTERLIAFARFFGDHGLNASWAEADGLTASVLNDYSFVLCVGKHAFDTCRRLSPYKTVYLVYIPVPGGQYTEAQAAAQFNALQEEQTVVYFKYLLKGDWGGTQYL